MNAREWLGKRVRVFAAYDHARQHAPRIEGEVIYYIDGPSIGVRTADGRVEACPITCPIDYDDRQAAQ
jgi:hypothetical protein